MSKETQQDKAVMNLVNAIKFTKENFNAAMHIDAWNLMARDRKIRYDAHIVAGFNDTQALYLCTQAI